MRVIRIYFLLYNFDIQVWVMTSYVLIFLFTLSSGEQIRATQDATHLEEYRPVKTLEQCQRVAMEREARMNRCFVDNPGLVQNVLITCKKATPKHKRKKK